MEGSVGSGSQRGPRKGTTRGTRGQALKTTRDFGLAVQALLVKSVAQ